MGKVAQHLMDKAQGKLLADNIHLIQENARLSRDADGKHRAWQAACEDLEKVREELRLERNANAALKATIARLTKSKGEA